MVPTTVFVERVVEALHYFRTGLGSISVETSMETSVDGVICVRADGAAGECVCGENVCVGVGNVIWEEGAEGWEGRCSE
jgi:hypothetical protein